MSTTKKLSYIAVVAITAVLVAIETTVIAKDLQTRERSTTPATSIDSQIIRRDFMIKSDPGIEIFVREVLPNSENLDRKVPILLIHGGGPGGIASFDLDIPGYSLAADLAAAEHPVYIMNARGWEKSTRPPELDEPAQNNPPAVTSEEVVRDIGAVVDWIRDRRSGQDVAIVGWATGGHWAGMYVSRNNNKVSHLVMLNSLYGDSPAKK